MIIDSFTSLLPLCTTPSARTLAPGRAKHVLHHPAPQKGLDAEQQRDPEPVPEHRHAVPFVTVVRARLAVSAVVRHSVLFVADERHVGRV